MRFFRHLVATLCLLGLASSAAPARAAGTLSFSPPIWEDRAADRLINKFNRKDCLGNAKATFSVALRNAPTNSLFQVWSGTGCEQYANRSPTAVNQTCTLVTGDLAPLDQSVVIYLRDMLAGYGTSVDQSEAECDASTTAGLQTRTLYFVVSDPSTHEPVGVTGTTSWGFTYDVKAPPPPSAVSAGSGDGSLVVKFTPPPNETNLLHYKFYCSLVGDPPLAAAGTGGTAGTDTGGTAGTDTGGTAGAETSGGASAETSGGASAETSGTSGTSSAGTAGTATVESSCHSSILVAGQPPPAGAIDCGEIGAQGSTGDETSPVLDNDVEYVVAVATEDNVNNIGVLSELACNVPKDTTGFFEAYTEAGGQAGGGYCTFAPAKRGPWAMLIGFVLGACALIWRRK